MKFYLKIICMLVLMSGCRKDIQKLIDCQEVPLYNYATFKIGVAVEAGRLKSTAIYKDKILTHFNSITSENALKMEFLVASPQGYYWEQADELVKFAEDNNLHLHGHTLVWGEQLPDWVYYYSGDYNELLKSHITKVVERYKGKIPAWDVVNEAYDDEGNLKENIWKEKIGADYIEKAFIWTHEADPAAFLFYNDYNLEAKSKKLNAVIGMLNDLKSRNIPVHGVGIQMHISHNYPTDIQIKNALLKLSETGLKVHISEFDVSVNNRNSQQSPTYQLLKEQKKKVKTVVETYKMLPPPVQYGITLWGVSDADTWIRTSQNKIDWPLLFDFFI